VIRTAPRRHRPRSDLHFAGGGSRFTRPNETAVRIGHVDAPGGNRSRRILRVGEASLHRVKVGPEGGIRRAGRRASGLARSGWVVVGSSGSGHLSPATCVICSSPTHPQHPDTHPTHLNPHSNACRGCRRPPCTRIARCRPSSRCARSAWIAAGERRSACSSPIACRCGCARLTPAHRFRRGGAGATSSRRWPGCGGPTTASPPPAQTPSPPTSNASANRKPPRPRPGSYAWPDLRRTIEAGYAAGATPGEVAPAVHARYAECPARPPSRRTIQRWHAQRRWLAEPP
jgi:hypothetical protein